MIGRTHGWLQFPDSRWWTMHAHLIQVSRYLWKMTDRPTFIIGDHLEVGSRDEVMTALYKQKGKGVIESWDNNRGLSTLKKTWTAFLIGQLHSVPRLYYLIIIVQIWNDQFRTNPQEGKLVPTELRLIVPKMPSELGSPSCSSRTTASNLVHRNKYRNWKLTERETSRKSWGWLEFEEVLCRCTALS